MGMEAFVVEGEGHNRRRHLLVAFLEELINNQRMSNLVDKVTTHNALIES